MSNLFQRMQALANPNIIEIPFDDARTPREQIEAAITSVKSLVCNRHPHEIRPVDKTATVRSVLFHDYPYDNDPVQVEFKATYPRCLECPHSETNDSIEVERCAVGVTRFGSSDISTRDKLGKPLPTRFGSAKLVADRSARDQLEQWLAKTAAVSCPQNNQLLTRRDASVRPPFESWSIDPQFAPCLQCGLERLGITPDEAHASFENLIIDPPELQGILDKCRTFAANPQGVLMLLGNVGTAKTHLAIAILRERLRRGASGLMFIKHRHFLARHWLAMRPVAFREEPPKSPMARCQSSTLLVYDELTPATDSRSCEDVLLDLFEKRSGDFKPSIITGNLSRGELEAALGSRLVDRLRRATFAVLEFGFESKRKSFNAGYLDRSRAAART